jgi:putative NADH-flavin reductase
MDKQTILLVGATGRSGRYIIKGLEKGPFHMKAMVRDPKKAEKILGKDIELVEGNLSRVREIQSALQGVDGLFINLGIGQTETEKDWHPMTDGMKYLLVCAKINEVKHIISHGMLAFSEGKFGASWRVGLYQQFYNLLSKSGIPFTYFRSSVFMENFQTRFRKGKDIRIHQNTDSPVSLLSASDLGMEMANAFFNPDFFNQSPVVLGKENFFLLDAAKKFVDTFSEEKFRVVNRDSNFFQLLSKLRPGMEEELDWFQQLKSFGEGIFAQNEKAIFMPTTFEDFLRNLQKKPVFEKEESAFLPVFL